MSLAREIRSRWKPRKKESHKGDYGRVFLLAGSREYSGAAYLTGLGALRAGAGLVTLGVPTNIHTILARRQPELILQVYPSTSTGALSFQGLKSILRYAAKQDVIAIGPGLSQHPQTLKLLRALLRKVKQPVVLDADGLNAVAGHPELLLKIQGGALLTPHADEFVRVFGGKIPETLQDRIQRACQAAKTYRCVIVLKGHKTVVAHPDGRIYLNTTGNPGMATAGSGDALTGILAALIGQKFSLWDAARFGVYLHGLAGDLAAREKGEVSLIAGDLLDFLPQAIKKSR